MEVVYESKCVEEQCTNLSAAKKLVGGNESIALALLARVNLLEQAVNFKDVVVQPQLHFHALSDKEDINWQVVSQSMSRDDGVHGG